MHSPAHQLPKLGFLAWLVCKLEPRFPALACAAWPVGCRSCYWTVKLPSCNRVLPPVTGSGWRDRLWGKEHVQRLGNVPSNGSPLHAWSCHASLQVQQGAGPQHARQGAGHPQAARLALCLCLEPWVQTHSCYHVPCRASWCCLISLDLRRQAF